MNDKAEKAYNIAIIASKAKKQGKNKQEAEALTNCKFDDSIWGALKHNAFYVSQKAKINSQSAFNKQKVDN